MAGDEQMTELYEEPSWHDPVQTIDELPAPADVKEGTMCFVETERTVYWMRGGTWESRANRGE